MRRRIAVGEDDSAVSRHDGHERKERLEALVDQLLVREPRGGAGNRAVGQEADHRVHHRLAALIGDLRRKGRSRGRLARSKKQQCNGWIPSPHGGLR